MANDETNHIIKKSENRKFQLKFKLLNKKEFNEFLLLIILFIMIYFFTPIFCQNYISLKVSENGNQIIINEKYQDKIQIIEGETTYDSTNQIDIANNENSIKILFISDYTTCDNMFDSLSNIIEIDLTYFDSSSVITMNYMFHNATNLKIITFPTNFDTSRVESMHHMFSNCISLTTLDLSMFNTQNVLDMTNLFNGCSNLEILNLNGWNKNSCRAMRKCLKIVIK